nr:hypothetical protein [Leisingera sp. HS039]
MRLWLKPPGANPAQPICCGLLRRTTGMTVQAAAMLLATALPAATDTFPVEIQHLSGLAAVPAKPERIVSVSFFGHSFLPAPGQTPINFLNWHGNDCSGVWPWGHGAMGDAPRAEFGSYGTPWQEMLHTHGAATGTSGRTETVITRTGSRVSVIRGEHPEWEGASAPLAWAGGIAIMLLCGAGMRWVMLLSAVIGAQLLTAADLLGRLPLFRGNMQAGVMTASNSRGSAGMSAECWRSGGNTLGTPFLFACDKAETQHPRAALKPERADPKTNYTAANWSQT